MPKRDANLVWSSDSGDRRKARERGIAPLEVAVDQARRRLREGSVVDRT
jgi:hypothetical protein